MLLLMILTYVVCVLSSEEDTIENDVVLQDFYINNKLLFDKLMKNYSVHLSPYLTTYNSKSSNASSHAADQRTVTHLSLIYARIVQVDQMAQLLKMIAEVRLIWNDFRLRWNPEEFGGIEYIHINREKLWVPPIRVANSEETTDLVPDYKQHVVVNYTGHVLWYNIVKSNSVCRLQTILFPFDVQNCSLSMIETAFNKDQFRIQATIAERVHRHYLDTGNGEWDVTNVTVTTIYKPEYTNVDFDIVNFNFLFKRKAVFYVMVIIIPTFIITGLSITGMFSKPIDGDDYLGELTLGLTSLMAMTVMLGIVADSLPKTNQLPILSIFLIIEVSLMAMAVLIIVAHPQFLFPKYDTVKRIIRKREEDDNRMLGFYRKYCAAHIFCLAIFQVVNVVNLAYLLSYWQ